MTFPLPLVPFEQYMLADNTPQYPRTFFLDLEFSGPLDREALETAWRRSIARHPLLNSRIVRRAQGWHWTGAEGQPSPAIHWLAPDAPLDFPRGEVIDLASESGLRMWVRQDASRARWTFQFHHACVDGVGGLQFVADLMAIYAQETSDDAPPLPPLDPDLLAGRGTFGLTRPTIREWLGHAGYTIRDSLRLLARNVLPVTPPRAAEHEAATLLALGDIDTYRSTPEELDSLRRQAEVAEVTINDLVMCHLLATIVEWNAEHSQRAPRGWLRINVPTNLRRREDQGMPAANVMSFTFVDRRAKDCRDSLALLDSIRRETRAIKSRRLGLYFIGQLALLSGIPGGMRLLLAPRRSFATAVLTNVGDLSHRFVLPFPQVDGKLRVGNLVVESITGTPPLRPLTHLGIGILIYAGRLNVTMTADRHVFTREQARQFLERYVARIRRGLPAAPQGGTGVPPVLDTAQKT